MFRIPVLEQRPLFAHKSSGFFVLVFLFISILALVPCSEAKNTFKFAP